MIETDRLILRPWLDSDAGARRLVIGGDYCEFICGY